MCEAKVIKTLISKTSKIRWLPYEYEHRFLTGSRGIGQTALQLWDLNIFNPNWLHISCLSPNRIVNMKGDVSGLEKINDLDFVMVTSTGAAAVVRTIDADYNLIEVAQEYEKLHKFDSNDAAPCTAVSTYDDHFATVGEDGRLNILSWNNKTIVREFKDDNIPLTSVSFINYNEILNGNRMGIVKMFDSRCDTDDPQTVFQKSCQDENSSVNAIIYHPTQKHIILSGSEKGTITVWDSRKPNSFASYFTAHSSAITELSFPKDQPNKLFSASKNGEFWLWCYNAAEVEVDELNPSLSGEGTKEKFNVTSVMNFGNKSINSFDKFDNRVIVGCDDAIYLIENMN